MKLLHDLQGRPGMTLVWRNRLPCCSSSKVLKTRHKHDLGSERLFVYFSKDNFSSENPAKNYQNPLECMQTLDSNAIVTDLQICKVTQTTDLFHYSSVGIGCEVASDRENN